MNKSEFVKKLSKELGIIKAEVGRNLDTILRYIIQSMKENDILKFVGFGAFKAKKVKAREMQLPNGKVIKVSAKRQVRFTAGQELKDVVNGR